MRERHRLPRVISLTGKADNDTAQPNLSLSLFFFKVP